MENTNNSLGHCNQLIKKINIIIKALKDEEMNFNSEENKIISENLEKANIALTDIEDLIIKNLKFGIKETLCKKKK